MNRKPCSLLLLPVFGLATIQPSPGAGLLIDFNSNQANGGTAEAPAFNQAGFQSYFASHEVSATFIARSYDVAFALTGAATVTLTPGFAGTSANTVRQSINRSDAQAASWAGNNVNLLRDFIGVDARPGEGGNGNYNGTDGTPTYLTITLGGLPASTYAWTSFHHDVENINSFFQVELSTNGGATFSLLGTGRITNSLAGGTPAGNEIPSGTSPNVPGGDPANLTSTQAFQFTATGDDVVIRFAPYAKLDASSPLTYPDGDYLGGVHNSFFALNGFTLEQVPEPSALGLGALGLAALLRRRRLG